MQAALQPVNEGDAAGGAWKAKRCMSTRCRKQQRAERDLKRVKRDDAGEHSRGERDDRDGERGGRAVAKECQDHQRPPLPSNRPILAHFAPTRLSRGACALVPVRRLRAGRRPGDNGPVAMAAGTTINRRDMLVGGAALIAGAALGATADAAVARAFDQDLWPPMDGREAYVAWMKDNRGEDPGFLGQRWDRYLQLISHGDIWDHADKRAFLMTPREEFVTAENLGRAYEWHYLDIGFGVTITGPHTVARMTNTLGVKPGDKVLEIGTGSGYQSAYLELPDRSAVVDRDHPGARQAHARRLRFADRARL